MNHPLRLTLALGLLTLGSCKSNNNGPCSNDQGCNTPQKCCSGACVDVNTSTLHCGACGNACGTTNAASRCTAGVCALTCSSGFGDCDSNPKNGCETTLATSTAHCGMCGHACASANATEVCDRNVCERTSCTSGYGDCNLNTADGCETNLKVSLAHCGLCGKKCEILNGTPECAAASCNVLGCDVGFGDCDMNPATGCETVLASSDQNCSACGMACAAGMHCKLGKCVAPELVFYGGLINVMSTIPSGQVSAFNVDTRAWASVSALAADGGLDVPAARFGHAAAWDSAGQQMLVFGGTLANNQPADNSLWSLDYGGAKPVWKKLSPTGGPPPTRNAPGVAFDTASRTLILFGGNDNIGNALNDVWVLDVATLAWSQRLDEGAPSPRGGAAMVWDAPKQRALVGLGIDGNSQALGGFWAFDLSSTDGGAWSVLTAPDGPSPRITAGFLGTAHPLQVWGGADEMLTPYFDLFTLDDVDGGTAQAWTQSQPANVPEGRAYALTTSAGQRRFLFGGFAYDQFLGDITPFDDVWELGGDAGWSRIADGGVNRVHPGIFFGSVVARE